MKQLSYATLGTQGKRSRAAIAFITAGARVIQDIQCKDTVIIPCCYAVLSGTRVPVFYNFTRKAGNAHSLVHNFLLP